MQQALYEHGAQAAQLPRRSVGSTASALTRSSMTTATTATSGSTAPTAPTAAPQHSLRRRQQQQQQAQEPQQSPRRRFVPRARTVAARIRLRGKPAPDGAAGEPARRRVWRRGRDRSSKHVVASDASDPVTSPSAPPAPVPGGRRSLRLGMSGSMKLLRRGGGGGGEPAESDAGTVTTASATTTTTTGGSGSSAADGVGRYGGGLALRGFARASSALRADGEPLPAWADAVAEEGHGSSRLVLSSRSMLSLSGRQFWLEAVEVKRRSSGIGAGSGAGGRGRARRAASPKRVSKFRVSARRRSSRLSGGSFVGDDERGDDGLDAVAAEAALEKMLFELDGHALDICILYLISE